MRSEAILQRPAASTLRAYVALTKPRIVWLLLITTVPPMVLAAGGWPSPRLIAATLVGGMLAAGGANAVNQYADRDIDALMERTRGRPLPAGVLAPPQALAFGLALAAASGVWLALAVNALAAALAVGAFAFYAVVYTYVLKRSTVQNIVVGGAAGAAPPLIGWAAVTGEVGLEAVFLFLIVFYWTPPHFWALSLVLAEDYRRAGVPMLPVVRGERETKRQIGLYSLMMAALTLAFAAFAGLGAIYLAAALLGGAAFLGLAWRLWRADGTGGAAALFHYSIAYLALLFGAMAADRLALG